MTSLTAFITQALSVLTILADILIVVVLVSVVFRKKGEWALHRFLRTRAVPCAFLVSLFAVCASLFYSEVAGFVPCSLCWIQRAFMFPLPFILLFAWMKGGRRAEGVALLLALFGSAVAAYNWFVQSGGTAFVACPPWGESCARIFFTMFGYITIPVMSLTAFALIAAIVAAGVIHRRS